jgi:hypothetical protein
LDQRPVCAAARRLTSELRPQLLKLFFYSEFLSLESGYSGDVRGGASRLDLDRRVKITVPTVEFANTRFKRH